MESDQGELSPVSNRSGPEGTPATDSIVLEEEIDPNYVPSEEEGMILQNISIYYTVIMCAPDTWRGLVFNYHQLTTL